jgi:hypothetical protein
MSYDISLSFQNIRKKNEAVEVVITKFLSPNLAKGGGAYVQYFLISFSNEMSETRQE